MEPIYNTANTNVAYQLNWSIALFGSSKIPSSTDWLTDLKSATEPDGVRILECHCPSSNVVQFLVSSLPALAPSQIIRCMKGRLQYIIRERNPKAFRRNYFIGSVGEVNSQVLDRYVGKQAEKHPMADSTVQSRMKALQFHDSSVDLSIQRTGNYGRYVHSLQIVLENSEDWHEVREEVLLGSFGSLSIVAPSGASPAEAFPGDLRRAMRGGEVAKHLCGKPFRHRQLRPSFR